jgi:hypothetical protein
MTYTQSIFKPLIYGILATTIAVLPCTGWTDVTGRWDTTALTRIDVTPIKAPGLRPEHRVEIYDGSYTFDGDFGFSAGDIQGRWQQRKSKYTVDVNRANLESQFRKSLEENSPGIYIKELKLVKRSLTGNQLDDGIWGTEKFEYKIDSTLDGFRDVIRLVMTVQVAGHPQTQATNMISSKSMAIQSVDAKSERNPAIDAAVATVLRRLKQQNSMEQ